MMFDQYARKARVQPALLVVLPVGTLLFAWLLPESVWGGSLGALLSSWLGTAFMAQIGRDLGKNKQQALWESWGGAPTTQLLRFRGSSNRTLLTLRRAKLEQLIGFPLPSEEAEYEDPAHADQKYEAAVKILIEATRDTKTFPLIYAENINYGFRRNLWGLKRWGLVISVTAAILSWLLLFWSTGFPVSVSWVPDVLSNQESSITTRLIVAIVNSLFTVSWMLIIKPQWVRTTAVAYAEQLLAAVDTLLQGPVVENDRT